MNAPTYRIGDCVDVLKEFPENHFDACVTDPPYGLGFMSKAWDSLGGKASSQRLSPATEAANNGYFKGRVAERTNGRTMQEWHHRWAVEALRVLKPGAHLLAFGGTRTHHRLMCALEDAGFEIRDCLMWLYGSGFPKSLDVSKAIDGHLDVEPSGYSLNPAQRPGNGPGEVTSTGWAKPDRPPKPIATSDEAKRWSGWGTALKPAWEAIVLARKPLIGTVAENVTQYGTGALNVDGCRILTSERYIVQAASDFAGDGGFGDAPRESHTSGRWPANLILDEEAAAMLDGVTEGQIIHSASRFFYVPKADREEREEGVLGREMRPRHTRKGARATNPNGLRQYMDDTREPGKPGGMNPRNLAASVARANFHPTVKPLDLMRYLVRLVTPPGGLVLDPFLGSGTTLLACRLEGFSGFGIEKGAEYEPIIKGRLSSIPPPIEGFE